MSLFNISYYYQVRCHNETPLASGVPSCRHDYFVTSLLFSTSFLVFLAYVPCLLALFVSNDKIVGITKVESLHIHD